MNTSNESNSISIQDLEQWFDEELTLYGNYVEIDAAKVHILNKAKRKIQEQSQAKLNSERINKVIQVLIEYDLAEDCSGSELIEVGPKGLDNIVQELNKALE